MRLLSLSVISIFFFITCNFAKKQQAELTKLRDWLCGSFSSQEQAEKDTNFYDIRLEMIQIWNELQPGYWLYVEQAAFWNLAKPYRQRVYHLAILDDSSYKSTVFELPNPLRFAGAYKNSDAFQSISPDSLIRRQGCSIILHPRGENKFVGSTEGKECQSDLRGAKYATSEVELTAAYLKSWDRGFGENDEQIWGSRHGPYIFIKR